MLVFGLTVVFLHSFSVTEILWIVKFIIPFGLISVSLVFFYQPED